MRFNGKKFKEIMQEKDISPEAMCVKTGLHITSLDHILEDGYASMDAMERLADAANVKLGEFVMPDISGSEENLIEFIKDNGRATVTFSQGRYKSRIKKLAETHPEQCRIIAENGDGSLCAHIPVEWIKINPAREWSEEQREAQADRIRRNVLHVNN